MKNIVLILAVVVLNVFQATAQDFTVKVIDKQRSVVPFAYLYVNDQIITVADSEGKGILPIDSLVVGDTLKVSFLGMKTQTAVLNRSILADKGYSFVMEEDEFNVNEVVVQGDAEAYFRKCTNLSGPFRYNCEMTAQFTARIMPFGDDREKVTINGSLSAENQVFASEFERPFQYGCFHHPVRYVTKDDTVGQSERLTHCFRNAIYHSNLAIAWAHIKLLNGEIKAHYSYLGMEGNNRLFLMAYSFTYHSFQSLLYVDAKTKDLTRLEIQIVPHDKTGVITVHGDYVSYIHKRPRKAAILLPNPLVVEFKSSNGRLVTFELRDPVIKPTKYR